MKAILPRESYEGHGGWHDGRLGQAYDLIHAAAQGQSLGGRTELLSLCSAIESADMSLADEVGEPA